MVMFLLRVCVCVCVCGLSRRLFFIKEIVVSAGHKNSKLKSRSHDHNNNSIKSSFICKILSNKSVNIGKISKSITMNELNGDYGDLSDCNLSSIYLNVSSDTPTTTSSKRSHKNITPSIMQKQSLKDSKK